MQDSPNPLFRKGNRRQAFSTITQDKSKTLENELKTIRVERNKKQMKDIG